jgi:hypothetical protein
VVPIGILKDIISDRIISDLSSGLNSATAKRRILPAQQRPVVEKLKPLIKLSFAFSILPEPEPTALMEDIAATLTAAGWTWVGFPVASGRGGGGLGYSIHGSPTINTSSFTLTDVQIEVPFSHQNDWNPPVIALCDALNAVPGITVVAIGDRPGTQPIIDGVVIWIGGKP